MLLLTRHSATYRATQKPAQWGPLSAVRGAVLRNADDLGVPGPILVIPLWDGAGGVTIIPSGSVPHANLVWAADRARFPIGVSASFCIADTDAPGLPIGTAGSHFCRGAIYHVAGNAHNVFVNNTTSGSYSGCDFPLWVSSSDDNKLHTSGSVVGNTTLGDGVEYSITSNYDGATRELWLDGSLDGSGAVTASTKGNWLRIGARVSGSVDRSMHGGLGIAAVWDVALTASQIATLHERPYALIEPPGAFVPFVFDLAAGTFKLVADAGTGADALALAATLSLADTGLGADGPGLGALLGAADAGAGSDAVALGAALTTTDAGTGADTLAFDALIAAAEQGAGAEAVGLAVSVTATEAGAGADLVTVLTELLKQIADAGTGADAVALGAALTTTDQGTGADTPTLTASIPVGDLGVGGDLVAVLAAIIKQIADAGAGLDQVALGASLTATDGGTGTEAPTLTAVLTVPDLGAGADAVTTLQQILKTIADAGVGADTLGPLTVVVPVADAGTGLDALSALEVALALADTGVGVDVAIRSGGTTGTRLFITLTGKTPHIQFTGKTP